MSNLGKSTPFHPTFCPTCPKINYRPAPDILSAIKGATLQWAKASEATDENVVEDDEEEDGPGGEVFGG